LLLDSACIQATLHVLESKESMSTDWNFELIPIVDMLLISVLFRVSIQFIGGVGKRRFVPVETK